MTVAIHLMIVGNRKKIETDNKPTWTHVNKYPDHKEEFNLNSCYRRVLLIECIYHLWSGY